MPDAGDRGFLKRLEAAQPDELASLIVRADAEQERLLREHFGHARYRRLHDLAVRRGVRGAGDPMGNVVVLHGIMGGELTTYHNTNNDDDLVWINLVRLALGRIARLRLKDDGTSPADPDYDARATAMLKRYYGETLLALSLRWNVKAFFYDWRKDLGQAAASLERHIAEWFGDRPVHLVAHSMGGLVARTFIARYPARWKSMRGDDLVEGGRLVMLGTPNHGSFIIPQVITGLEGMVRKIAGLDRTHTLAEILEIVNTFPGSCQMLPSPLVVRGAEALYTSDTWHGAVLQRHLTEARHSHDRLRDVVDVKRMIYVAGYNQLTPSGMNFGRPGDIDQYATTLDGDGRVPHELGRLRANGATVPMYFVEENHGDLPVNAGVLSALDDLLEKGTTTLLPTEVPAGVRRLATRHRREGGRRRAAEAHAEEKLEKEIERLEAFARRVEARQRSGATAPPDVVSAEARVHEEVLTRGWLPSAPAETGGRVGVTPMPPTSVEIGLWYGGIEAVHTANHGLPVDAIAVGHYIGVRPQNAELALDRALSAALRGAGAPEPAAGESLITQYTDRGTIQGNLGQPFFLLDPRPGPSRGGRGHPRLIVLAGMGRPASFGTPELAVLAREVCWAVGRLERRHLATVLIGSGSGNIPVDEAVSAWLRGIKHAVSGAAPDAPGRIQRITFVESDPRRLQAIRKAIFIEKERLARQDRLEIRYTGLSEREIDRLRPQARSRALQDFQARWKVDGAGATTTPTRVTVSFKDEEYRFGAITNTASMPEREIAIDQMVVKRANDELAGESDLEIQVDRGRLLEALLIPADLRNSLYSEAPVVMVVDRSTARIHWEMVAQPEASIGARTDGASGNAHSSTRYSVESFLAIGRGFTRQLRTVLAPLPEPPPPPRRQLRVLVVADPAADNRLAGAEREGVQVADLFEQFNVVHRARTLDRIEVVRLIGPSEATRTNVLRELTNRWYDVLHFAGHCVFDEKHPARSGWIFTGDERLSANELRRIDRIPKFIFSNACESGVTPEDRGKRNADLAPSFAEAFFERGVANLVCTAWPVEDEAALRFALRLYSRLLGVPIEKERAADPTSMHIAMRDARKDLAIDKGVRTWGAYQHYGNPHFRFFEPASWADAREGDAAKARGRRRGTRRSGRKRSR